MTNTNEQATFSSVVACRNYGGAWYCSVALRRRDELDNQATRFVFALAPPPEPWSFQSHVGDLFISRGWMRRADAEAALAGSRTGHLPLGDAVLRVADVDAPERKPYRWQMVDRPVAAKSEIGWRAASLEGTVSQPSKLLPFEMWENLESRLPAAEPRPFRGWAGLSDYLGLKLEHRVSAAVDVFAPEYRRISEASTDRASGEFSARIEILDGTSDATLSLLPSDLSAEPLSIPQSDWERESDGLFRVGASVTPDIGVVDVHLVSGESTDDDRVVGAPSLASRAHGLFETDETWLRNMLGLEPKKATSDGFEHGVGALLPLAGMPAVYYGFSGRDHFPDFVVCNGGWSLVAECTTDVPTRSKVEQLAARAHKVSSLITEWYGSFMHARALFTALPWRQMPNDVVEAACEELHGALVCRERLELLYEMATRGESAGAFWAKLQNWGSSFGALLTV